MPALLAALCAAVAGCAGVVEGGSCGAVNPSLEANPAQAAPNDPFSVQGKGFYGEFVYNDTGTPDPPEPNGAPTGGIRVEFVQGPRT